MVLNGALSDAEAEDLPQHGAKVVAAIPAYNEEKTIGSMVLLARKYADEVLVVDDGSRDNTAWVAEQAGAIVIQHLENRGYGAALRTCFNFARRNDAGILVVLDGDGQHRANLIPRVIAPVAEGKADVCIGSRFMEGHAAANVPRYRRFGIGILTRLTNLGTARNGKVLDSQSGFRAYSRAAIDGIDPLETNMGAGSEILWEADRKGLRVLEVPIEVDYDAHGLKRGPVGHGLSVIGSMIRFIETKHALLFFGVPGITLFLVGLGLGFLVVQTYQRTAELAVGSALITIILLVIGTLMTFTGLVIHAVINAAMRTR